MDQERQDQEHFRNQLNTYAARAGKLPLKWDDTELGPLDNSEWVSIVYIDDFEWGRGRGPRKASAREAAAKEALNVAARLAAPQP